jgi:PIN domain nuclease of toxin-antitoxin system
MVQVVQQQATPPNGTSTLYEPQQAQVLAQKPLPVSSSKYVQQQVQAQEHPVQSVSMLHHELLLELDKARKQPRDSSRASVRRRVRERAQRLHSAQSSFVEPQTVQVSEITSHPIG